MAARVDGALEPARTAFAWRRLLVRAGQGVGILYPAALLAIALALRYKGEGWWMTTIGLYLPRIVLAAPLPFVLLALYALRVRRWLWSQLASALLLLFPLMGFVLPWPHWADAGQPKLRVLSYNINSGYGGADAVFAEIEKYSPDLVLLQETGRTDDLEKLLRTRYETVDIYGEFVLATHYPILSKYEPGLLPFYGRMRSSRYVQRILDTPLGHLAVYNVHPTSPRQDFGALRGPRGLRREISSGHLFSGSSASVILDNASIRGRQVDAFSYDSAHETEPVVIAGDTNLPGLSRIFARYLSGYQDGFGSAGWGFGYTYPSDEHRPVPWMRIDRILASDQLRFVKFEVGESRASDHRCVVADLQRR
jgi:endonuclease/exonuclease/phosphatase (EEP) superfamily protein YafD